MVRAMCRGALRILGWKIKDPYPHHIQKMMIIVAPHTSNWDYVLGIVYKIGYSIQVNYLGKHTLFRPPFGWFFRYFGGIPVDRKKNSNFVETIVQLFQQKEKLTFVIAPEGTRSKINVFRKGFYHICRQASVPLVMMQFDFGNKEIKIHEPIMMTENMDADFEKIYSYFRGVEGKIPENGIS